MHTETYVPMLNGPATNLLGQIDLKKSTSSQSPFSITVDKFQGFATIQHKSLFLYLDDWCNLKSNLTVGVHKLFDILVLQLTQQNSYRSQNPNPAVKISLHDYMSLSGIPDTKSSMDSARKVIKTYLDTLSRISMKWEEGAGKKVKGYQKQQLFKSCRFEKGFICAEFSVEMAQYLISHWFITQYPTALLKLDDRKGVAYYIGKKLAFHYGLRSNIFHQRNNCISVSSLLAAVPSLSIEQDPSHWKRRVQAVFENALKTLEKVGIIESWDYCSARRQPITDISAATFSRFLELYLQFEIANFPLPTPKQRKSSHTP